MAPQPAPGAGQWGAGVDVPGRARTSFVPNLGRLTALREAAGNEGHGAGSAGL